MVSVAGYTHVGKRDNNEDSFMIGNNFAVVADGMGGHSKGEVASAIAVESIRKQLETVPCISEKDVLNAVKTANLSIYNKASENEFMRDMGTTIVMCTWNENNVIVANVGDSRCYMFSPDNVVQITTDHSYVQSLVDSGEISATEAEHRSDKNIILRAAGCEATIETDTFEFSVQPGYRVLLCSDGLSGFLTVDEMKKIVFDSDNPETISQVLVNKAYENGGTDNITAVVVVF